MVQMTRKPVAQEAQFHFEYTLKAEELEAEGIYYTGLGVMAKMVDSHGNQITEYIPDVTTEVEIAHRLLHHLKISRVSPMCLRMFVEDFLACL